MIFRNKNMLLVLGDYLHFLRHFIDVVNTRTLLFTLDLLSLYYNSRHKGGSVGMSWLDIRKGITSSEMSSSIHD
jgi:hypothetical protein